MIDPNLINTIRVGELPSEPFNLTDSLPHEIGTDLKSGSIQQLVDLISTVISVSDGVGFRAVSVTDGQTLPTTIKQEFILVGKGTFYNVSGGQTIVLTEELNALVSNGSFWFVGVEIPINVELAGITQFVRQGFTTTSPSENAVFNAISNLDINEVIEATNFASLPLVGLVGKIYITLNDNLLFRWNGSGYTGLTANISGKEDIANKSSSFTSSSTTTYANTKALVDGLATKQATISGTTNVIPKFGSGGLVESNIFDNGTNVGIGTITPDTKLDVRINNSLNAPSAYFINNDGNAGTIALIGQDTFSKNGFFGYYGSGSGSYRGLNPNTAYFGAGGGASQLSLNTNGATPITFHTGDWLERMRISDMGKLLVGTTTDNNQGIAQFNGNITASPATLSSQVTTFGQVFTSPAFTGTPTAPTATAGSVGTQIANKDYVLANAGSVGSLEFNATDLTVWNNGKGNVATNTSFGDGALKVNTTGSSNTAFGQLVLTANTTGNSNTGVGTLSLTANISGTDNTAIGLTSLTANTTGNSNTALGMSSLSFNTIGSNNIAVGKSAGNASPGNDINNSVFLGVNAVPGSNSQTNQIVIGHNTTGAGSNTATLGNASITRTILRGFVEASNIAVQLKDFFTDVNNVGITETDLYSYTTVANRLNATGEKLISVYAGTFNDATASSQIKVIYGGQTIGDTGALTMSVTGAWVTTVSIIRTGSTTARAIVNITTPSASTAAYTKYTSLTGLTFTGTNIIKITGTASGATGGDNDITATYGNIIWQPAAL